LRHMIGSTAEATLFQFAVTLIIHNVMRLIQAHVSEAQNTSPEELSLPKLIRTAKKQMVSLTVFVPAGRTAELILSRDPTPARVAQMLGRLWDDDWIKARRKKNRQRLLPPRSDRAHTHLFTGKSGLAKWTKMFRAVASHSRC